MDAFESFHPVPAAWLRDSDLAPFVPTYVRRLIDRHYAASTVRMVDVVLGTTSCVRLHGKGRKQRSLPLWKEAAREIRDWLSLNPQLEAGSALLPRRDGGPMTRANATQRLKLAVVAATACHPELGKLSVSPHMVRHYLPNRTMSCDFLTRASMSGDWIFSGAISPSITRHSPLSTGC